MQERNVQILTDMLPNCYGLLFELQYQVNELWPMMYLLTFE